MALYAFDGTWNKNQPQDDKDTNVRKFFEAYSDKGNECLGHNTYFHSMGCKEIGSMYPD